MTDTKFQAETSVQAPKELAKDWIEIKKHRNLLEVAAFLRNVDNTDVTPEVRAEAKELYDTLRKLEWEKMVANPSHYGKLYIEGLIANNVYSHQEMFDAGIMTEDSWKAMQTDRDLLPDMSEFQSTSHDMQSRPRATDVYFFGMPSSGKTALLMGMATANGQGYIVDMRNYGGPYAAALRQFAQLGLLPGRTHGKFVTTICGSVAEEGRRGKVKNHPINLIEMSGEEFTLRIAETKEPSISNMGTNATNLMRNDNRKVFFIIVDASQPKVKVSYLDHEIDEVGDISQRVRTRYVSQLDILDKFVSLISLPENEEIMNKVDAIHFIVTKSDTIDETPEKRRENAEELVNNQYLSVVEQLKNLMRRSRHINRNYDFEPQVFTYSLGKFYVGDVFDYDSTDTLTIVDAIRNATNSSARSLWDRIKEWFRLV